VLKTRVVPVLTFNGFALVKTRNFAAPRMVGNPIQTARVYDGRGVDELFFIDIVATRQNRPVNPALIEKVLAECYMPTGVGGGIQSLDDIARLLAVGADKVVIGSRAFRQPRFLAEAVQTFGAQAICVSVDAFFEEPHGYRVRGPETSVALLDFVKGVEAAGAGELLVNSIDRDGTMEGFDDRLVALVVENTSLPVVACGGAGSPQHFVDLYSRCRPDAMAAASIYHFTQYTPYDVKLALASAGAPVRLTAS